MLNLCTIADNSFLIKFLAFRRSVKKYKKNYRIELLCMDQKIYDNLNNKYNDVRCHLLQDLLHKDKLLEKAKNNDPSYEALNVSAGNIEEAKRMQFIWALASYFSWYCLTQLELEDIIYADADLYFFNSLEVLENLKDYGSIGLIENRVPYNSTNGKYNVGLVYFKNDKSGYECLEFWKNCLLDENNKYAKEYGTCGDQKYLELFSSLFDRVFRLDNLIGHLAPWSAMHHTYLPGGNRSFMVTWAFM